MDLKQHDNMLYWCSHWLMKNLPKMWRSDAEFGLLMSSPHRVFGSQQDAPVWGDNLTLLYCHLLFLHSNYTYYYRISLYIWSFVTKTLKSLSVTPGSTMSNSVMSLCRHIRILPLQIYEFFKMMLELWLIWSWIMWDNTSRWIWLLLDRARTDFSPFLLC